MQPVAEDSYRERSYTSSRHNQRLRAGQGSHSNNTAQGLWRIEIPFSNFLRPRLLAVSTFQYCTAVKPLATGKSLAGIRTCMQ